MRRDQLLMYWGQLRDEAAFIWGELTDADLDAVRGNVVKLIERVQERYGYDWVIAEDQVNRFLNRYSPATLTYALLSQTGDQRGIEPYLHVPLR